MAELSREECLAIIVALREAREKVPPAARQMRMKLLTLTREHDKALKMFDRALEHGEDPQIRSAGSLEPGEYLRLGAGPLRARRVTETGIEIMQDGKWSWENVSSRTTPVCVVDSPELER